MIITEPDRWIEGNGIRLHIWHDDINTPFKTVFNKHHRHSFLSESFVLLGDEITDRLYAVTAATVNTPNAVRMYKTPINKIIPDKIVTLKEVASRTAKRGFVLHYPANLFHLHQENSGVVATLFKKHTLSEDNPVAVTTGSLKLPSKKNKVQDPRKVIPHQEEIWKFVFISLIEMANVYQLAGYSQIKEIVFNIDKILHNDEKPNKLLNIDS